MDEPIKTTAVKIVEQDEPVPVVIADTAQPLPVEVVATQPDPHTATKTVSHYSPPMNTVAKASDMVASPTTTSEEDRHTASQRQINRKWENVQGTIAIMVTTTACAISFLLIWRAEYALGIGLISTMVGTVIIFYFQRTNHEKVGGVQTGQIGR